MSETRKLAMLVADVVRTSRSDRDELKPNVDDGRQDLFRARNGMAALARTPVLPGATPVGSLSALLRRTDGDPRCPLHVDCGHFRVRAAMELEA